MPGTPGPTPSSRGPGRAGAAGQAAFRRRHALLVVAGGAALVALLWFAWPRRADAGVLDAYAQLERAPVPVRVVGWIQATAPSAQVLADGYVLTVHAERLGDVTISGRRGLEPAQPQAGAVVWREGDVTYTLETTADQTVLQPRLVSLETARQQLTGNVLDTPILYLGYLPIFAAFTVWSADALLIWPLRH